MRVLHLKEELITQFLSVLSEWRKYKRRADNIEVSARLVTIIDQVRGKIKVLEIKENRMPDFACPNCKHLITQGNSQVFPNFFLEPKIFHEGHKPI